MAETDCTSGEVTSVQQTPDADGRCIYYVTNELSDHRWELARHPREAMKALVPPGASIIDYEGDGLESGYATIADLVEGFIWGYAYARLIDSRDLTIDGQFPSPGTRAPSPRLALQRQRREQESCD